MAVIYLRHPKHGAKVACSDMEAEYDMNQGWEPFNPTEPATEPEVEPEPAPPVNELPRRGRPRKNVEPTGV